jgi:hypothetical protein
MPFYTFEHPDNKEIIEIFFHMNDEKKHIDENGTQWTRVYHPTSFAFDTQLDPHDSKAFVKKTEKGGTLGDIMDLSQEMNLKRGGDKNDEVKVKYTKDREAKLEKRRRANAKEDFIKARKAALQQKLK